jgi:hypothetical protein
LILTVQVLKPCLLSLPRVRLSNPTRDRPKVYNAAQPPPPLLNQSTGQVIPVHQPWQQRLPTNPSQPRPDKVTPEHIARILAGYAVAAFLHDMLDEEGMPSLRVWQSKLSDDPNLRAIAAQARMQGADWCAAEADRMLSAATPYDVSVVRERVAHLRWRAARLNPATYGDRSQLEITGSLDVNHRLVDDAPAWLKGAIEGPGLVIDGQLCKPDDPDSEPTP